MQLTEVFFIAPLIKSVEVFRAIEAIIASVQIEQTFGKTNSVEERVSSASRTVIVESFQHSPHFDGECFQEPLCRFLTRSICTVHHYL